MQQETATGSSSSSRVRTMITIEVETIDFDTQACMLRLKGRNVEENQYVKVKLEISFVETCALNCCLHKTLSLPDGSIPYCRC